jgi:hypothetical protein
MPLTEEQTQALDVLKAADPAEFAEALKDSAQPLYQKVFNLGHSTANKAAKADADALKAERDQARTEAEDAKKVAADKPDPDKLHEQYRAQIAKLNSDNAAELERVKAQTATERKARTVADAKAALSAAGLHPDVVDIIAEKHVSRIRHREDGGIELLETGTEIPVQLAAGQTPFAALAADVKKAAPPAWLTSHVDSGSGSSGGGGGSSRTAADFKQATESTVNYTI